MNRFRFVLVLLACLAATHLPAADEKSPAPSPSPSPGPKPAPAAADSPAKEGKLVLHARQRVESPPGSGNFTIENRTLLWNPTKTAIVICDMWDKHWCQGATSRVADMAGRMNEAVSKARDRGVLIIHCPSSCLDAYQDRPERKLAQSAPKVETKVPLQNWCKLTPDKEPPLPIDDSDGGCDDQPQCKQGNPWRMEIAAIDIKPGDAITDSAEAFYLMKHKGIENVIVMGVHANMCVLGRPFSIRQMVNQGQNVVLMRDLTDSMYNSRKRPYVSHFRGTELVVEHIEKYWCPSVTSTDLTGLPPFRFTTDPRPSIALVHDASEYQQDKSLPHFAQELQDRFGYHVVDMPFDPTTGFAGLAGIERSDLVILFARREAVPTAQLAILKKYLADGKPLVALRTASHAFSPNQKGPPPQGTGRWDEFDADILGGHYAGHTPDPAEIFVDASVARSPLLPADGSAVGWNSSGTLYKVSPIDPAAKPILYGKTKSGAKDVVAWTRLAGKSRVFYTSLGHPDDFKQPAFRNLLIAGVHWAMDRQPPAETKPDERK